jgi:H+/Cl- antiporter ClcA
VGVAVGLRSPFVAVFLLPEMLGDYSLVPAIGFVVALAMVLDRGVDQLVERYGRTVPARVFDEDA